MGKGRGGWVKGVESVCLGGVEVGEVERGEGWLLCV